MTKRSTLVLLWTLAVLGLLVGLGLVVLGAAAGGVTGTQAAAVTGLGLLVLAGAGWQLTRLLRYRRAAGELTSARTELAQALDTAAPGRRDASPAGRTGPSAVHEAARPVRRDDTPAREVRAWHLAVAWAVAAVIAAIGVLFLAGGLVGLLGGSNEVAGALLAVVGLVVLWGDLTYARGIIRSRRGLPGASVGPPDRSADGSADGSDRPHLR